MAAGRPTVYDVAARAGVSIATVSFAFSQPDRVKPSTLASVLAAAGALGYVPSANARALATGRTGAIGLYAYEYLPEPGPRRAPEASGIDLRQFPLYGDEVQHGVELECRRRGYALMLGAGRRSEHLPAVIDIAGRVDGLIALADSAPPEAIGRVARRIPVVELGAEAGRSGVRTVLVDNRAGMRRLTEHLLGEHRLRRLVYLGVRDTAELASRYQGFADALAAAGLPAPEPVYAHPADEPATAAAVERYQRADGLPEAFVCGTDQVALTVLDALAAAGVPVPERVAVTGFDGILAGRFATPRLATVRQPIVEIGRTAVRILAGILDGILDGAGGAGPGQEPLPTSFLPGGSCGCAPSGCSGSGP